MINVYSISNKLNTYVLSISYSNTMGTYASKTSITPQLATKALQDPEEEIYRERRSVVFVYKEWVEIH
jgi:hypothetical protein